MGLVLGWFPGHFDFMWGWYNILSGMAGLTCCGEGGVGFEVGVVVMLVLIVCLVCVGSACLFAGCGVDLVGLV